MAEQTIDDTLVFAAIRGDLSTLNLAIAQGANINARSSPTGLGQDNTALMWAAAEGHDNIIRFLLAQGATVNTANPAGYTALMYAAEAARYEGGSMLLDANAESFPLNPYQETIVMAIARAGFADLAQRLVDLGVPVNAENRSGETALYLAAK